MTQLLQDRTDVVGARHGVQAAPATYAIETDGLVKVFGEREPSTASTSRCRPRPSSSSSASGHGGPLGVLAAVALLLVFAFSLSWVWKAIGLRMQTPESVMQVSMSELFPLTFASNVFVDPSTMPGWLLAFVEVHPITHT